MEVNQRLEISGEVDQEVLLLPDLLNLNFPDDPLKLIGNKKENHLLTEYWFNQDY